MGELVSIMPTGLQAFNKNGVKVFDTDQFNVIKIKQTINYDSYVLNHVQDNGDGTYTYNYTFTYTLPGIPAQNSHGFVYFTGIQSAILLKSEQRQVKVYIAFINFKSEQEALSSKNSKGVLYLI